jgi:hypothetical protein
MTVERLVLGLILGVALGALVLMVMRSIRRAGQRVSNPACAGCPFVEKCDKQDVPHDHGADDEEGDER